MAKINIVPNASGAGTFTIASPSGATDRTFTLPDSDGTPVMADSGNVTITGTVSVAGAATFESTVSASSINLTTGLTVPNGGTGAGTFTTNGVIYGNGTSALAATATGTSGQVLTSNGSGSAPTFQNAAGGGAWAVISSISASNSGDLTVTGLSSTYSDFFISLSDIVPATANTAAWFRVGDSGGIDSGAGDYEWHCQKSETNNGAYSGAANASDTKIILADSGWGNTGGDAAQFGIWIHTTPNTAKVNVNWHYTGHYDAAGSSRGGMGFGLRDATINLDRVQFLMASGNITSGKMTVWGIANA